MDRIVDPDNTDVCRGAPAAGSCRVYRGIKVKGLEE
jgi:hypothetical protein